MNLTAKDLTPGERLLLDRRRMPFMTQRAAADSYGVPTHHYIAWEADAEHLKPGAVPRVKLGPLRPHEIALICRRRAGWTQADVGAEIGRSAYWVARMERGEVDPAPLVEYWAAWPSLWAVEA